MYAHFEGGFPPSLYVLSVIMPSGSASYPGDLGVVGRATGERAALTMLHSKASDVEALCALALGDRRTRGQ